LVKGICPKCNSGFAFPDMTIEDVEGVTTDCPNCDILLLVKDGSVYEFHKKLHDGDSRWPVDGNSANFVNIGEE